LATTFCPVCKQTAVRLAGDVCSYCRAKGHVAIRDTRVSTETEKLMGALEPRILVENGLRQARIMQARLQQVIDSSETFRGDIVNENLKVARVLQTLTKEWRQLAKEAREAADQMGQEERMEVLSEWFGQLTATQQRDLIQRLTQIYNERAA
jgi:uncharacterized membrane-anchored protein YhcB (DUF1043 family)